MSLKFLNVVGTPYIGGNYHISKSHVPFPSHYKFCDKDTNSLTDRDSSLPSSGQPFRRWPFLYSCPLSPSSKTHEQRKPHATITARCNSISKPKKAWKVSRPCSQ